MPDHVRTLLAVIERYALCDRYPEIVSYRMLAEMGKLSQSAATQLLFQLQDVIDELEDFPNPLHRPPNEDQLYADGKPDIEVGTLIEGDELDPLPILVPLVMRESVGIGLLAGPEGGAEPRP